jgi:hypothetical protein
MSTPTEKLAQIRELAEQLYGALAIGAGRRNWDWQPIAITAIEAAEVFCAAFEERYTPQSAVPVDQTPVRIEPR